MGSCGNQTVGLRKGHASGGEGGSPRPCPPALVRPYRQYPQTAEQHPRCFLFAGNKTPYNLLDSDRTDEYLFPCPRQGFHPLYHGPASQEVDQNRAVQQNRQLPDSVRVAEPLTADPLRRIVVPFVPRVGNRASGGSKQLESDLLLNGILDGLANERRPPSRARYFIDLLKE